MTTNYSDAVRQERYQSARRALDELRGQLLTGEQMSEIFGLHDYNGSLMRIQEDCDAFMQILSEGWLFDDRSGAYRVADRTRGEADKIDISEKQQVSSLIQGCAEEIKRIVLAQAQIVQAKFPSTKFIWYSDYLKTNTKKITDRSALVLFSENKGNGIVGVVLTPDGIFEYSYEMDRQGYWHFEIQSERTNPLLWIQYGEQALNELNRL